MRESREEKRTQSTASDARRAEIAYDERTFFESFYRSNLEGEPEDRMTIGSITPLEARFHYNAVENSILRALARIEPPPSGPMVRAWARQQARRGLRLLDVGSGTGHWVDFFRGTLYVREVVAVEITARMAGHLREKYAGEAVTVLEDDVAEDGFGPEKTGGAVNLISAIGVMFHIVDDERWRAALTNLASTLAPGGLLFIGDDFGSETRNVQFHRSDEFQSWREFEPVAEGDPEVRVNKRVRSLADWQAAATACGLAVVDLVRTDREPHITTPENDVLVLRARE